MISTTNPNVNMSIANSLGRDAANQSFMGNVIRVSPNCYIYVCTQCNAEFREPHSFMYHCENHFQTSQTQLEKSFTPSNRLPNYMRINPYSFDSLASTQPSTLNSSSQTNHVNDYFESSMHQYQMPSACGPFNVDPSMYQMNIAEYSTPSHANLSQMVVVQPSAGENAMFPEPNQQFEEIYEIYDLGYDEAAEVITPDVNNVEPVPIHKAKKPKTQKIPKPKIPAGKRAMFHCSRCPKKYKTIGHYANHIFADHKIPQSEAFKEVTAAKIQKKARIETKISS